MSAEGIQADIQIPDREAVDNAPKPEISLKEELQNALAETKKPPEGESEEAKAARVRDEQGRFAEGPKEGKARETLTIKDKALAPVAAVLDPATPTTPPAAPASKAPVSWPAAMKEEFGKLAPHLQEYIATQEANARKAITAQDEDRTFGKKIREQAAPYLATIRAEGGDEAAAFGQFLNYAHIMRQGSPQQKAMALRQVAQAYNVDLGTPFEQGPRNPEFESLQQRIDRIERERQEEIQQRQLQEQSTLSSEIEAFASQPGHEHFEAVKTLMGNLLQSGEASTMQEAYDQAIWAKPEIRSTLAAQQQREAQEKRDAEAKAKADAARQAAGSITGGPGGVRPNGAIPERSLGEELRANMRAAVGRV